MSCGPSLCTAELAWPDQQIYDAQGGNVAVKTGKQEGYDKGDNASFEEVGTPRSLLQTTDQIAQ